MRGYWPNYKIAVLCREGERNGKVNPEFAKAEGAELSTPVKTQAEDSTPFTDDKIAYYLSTVNSGGEIGDK